MKESPQFGYQLELEILNYSLRDRSFWLLMLNSLEPHYFDNRVTKSIFVTFKLLFEKYNKLPSENILFDRLKNVNLDKDTVKRAADVIYDQELSGKDKQYLLDEVKSFTKKARMRDALYKSVDLLQNDSFDEINDLVKDALLFNIDIDLGIDIWKIEERYERINQLHLEKVPSGWTFIDKVLGGGFEKKSLFCFGAPPGIGKSIFLVNVGANALLKNYNVAVYTFEISEERLGMRYDACMSRIPSLQLKNEVPELKKKMNEIQARTQARLYIKEFPTRGGNVNSIKAHLEKLKVYEGFTPDMIIVDYADIMKPTHAYSSKYEELGNIYENLRGLAVEMEVPIITASQTNRESMDKEGGTKEIISGALIADSIIKLQILDFFATISQSQDQKGQNKMTLYVAKNRNGESSMRIEFDIDYGTFRLTQLLSS